MKKIVWAVLLAWVLWLPSFAEIAVGSLIAEVITGADDQLAGGIRYQISGDDFADASLQNPYYIRIRIDHGSQLAETRVAASAQPWSHKPIHLALKLVDPQANQFLLAHPRAVSIVRWVEGENQIWLRVNSSSSNWVFTGGVGGPPTQDHPVQFMLGQTTNESLQDNLVAFLTFRANLPANINSFGQPKSTQITVDLTQSNLQPAPAPPPLSFLNVDHTAFDATTQNVTSSAGVGGIVVGNLAPISFINGTTPIGITVGTAKRSEKVAAPLVQNDSNKVYFLNTIEREQTIELLAYNEDGLQMASRFLSLAPSSHQNLDLGEFFKNGGVSYFRIAGADAGSVLVTRDEPISAEAMVLLPATDTPLKP